ncbi:uncharacterized protein TNCV_1478891 [Trichonephila clavipes]|nr:uncharacterized protein TNCV_1478891 [Trichonephila clavipes]
MPGEASVDHIFVRLEPQVRDYVDVRNPTTTAQLLEVLAKFEDIRTRKSRVRKIVQVKKSRAQVITAQGATCRNVGIIELNVRIKEFAKPWMFHVLADLEFPCIFGVDFMAAVAEWYRYGIVACFVTSSIPVPLKTRRVGQRCTLNLSRAETSSRWCGVAVKRGVSSTSLDHGSKLRGPSPNALV